MYTAVKKTIKNKIQAHIHTIYNNTINHILYTFVNYVYSYCEKLENEHKMKR